METSQGRSRRRDSYAFNEIGDDTSCHRYIPSPSSSSSATIHWVPPPAPAEGPSSSANSPAAVEKEHLFDKVVTPSDVGKLNRLVIPKQHAERYFPLDTATNEKGLLLCFEDRAGKPWRFRYSYWNSSQSYVMTKGWSRFVKEKRLDAGDTVSFGRAVEDKERLFIDWKRRPEMVLDHPRLPRIPMPMPMPPMVSFARSVGPAWAGRYVVPQAQNYLYNAGASGGGRQYVVLRSPVVPQPQAAEVRLGGGVGTAPMVLDSVPVVQSQTAAAAKRVRLLGVNLDFPDAANGDSSIPSAAFSSSASPSPKGKEKEEPSLDLGM